MRDLERTLRAALAAIPALAFAASAVAAGFKPYPGAKPWTPPDTEATRRFNEALRPGTRITVYLTDDAYDKVVAFYAGVGRVYRKPGAKPMHLPGGVEVRKAFFILDDAIDLVRSLNWVSVQSPFIGPGTVKDGKPLYDNVRDVTEIVWTQRTSTPQERSQGQPGTGAR
jgi:hypothetical protein